MGPVPLSVPLLQWARLWLTPAAGVPWLMAAARRPALSETLLHDIGEFCRRARKAESTFGRLAVNDGKLVSRLRLGGRVTTTTVERVQAFIARQPEPAAINGVPV